jgi:hypothetical protein
MSCWLASAICSCLILSCLAVSLAVRLSVIHLRLPFT